MAVIGGTEIIETRGSGGAPLNSPAFTGTPTAPTAAPGTNTTQIATTAFVTAAVLVETNRAEAAEAALPQRIASGTAALGTTAIPANTAEATVTVAAAGVLATDSIEWAFNAAPGTGYVTGLYVLAYVTAGNVNFVVVNPTAGALTPAAATLNWRVIR
jgi:hypothetical protein